MVKNVCLMLAVLLMVHLSCDAASNRIGGEVDNTSTATMILWDIHTAVQDGRYTDHLADIAAQIGCYELAELISNAGGGDNA